MSVVGDWTPSFCSRLPPTYDIRQMIQYTCSRSIQSCSKRDAGRNLTATAAAASCSAVPVVHHRLHACVGAEDDSLPQSQSESSSCHSSRQAQAKLTTSLHVVFSSSV